MNCHFCQSSRIKNYLKAQDFTIMVCADCEIAFTHPAPDLPKYEEMDFHANRPEEQMHKPMEVNDLPYDWQRSIIIQLEMAEKFVKKGGSITEIGCGEGLLLSELKKKGFSVFGIEPSHSATARANKRGLNVEQGYFPAVHPAQKQDMFIISHVLEHVEDANAFIKELSEHLNPGGLLLLAQTNYKGLIPKVKKEEWYAWVPEHHFWHFSLKGLSMFLSKFGFKKAEHIFNPLVHPHDRLYKLAKLRNAWIDQFIVLYKKQ